MRNPIDNKTHGRMGVRMAWPNCHLVVGRSIACLIILCASAASHLAHGQTVSARSQPTASKTENPAATKTQPTDSQDSTQAARRLWAGRISAPTPPDDIESSDELQRLIAQIRSVQFEPRTRPPRPAPIERPAATTDPNDVTTPREPNMASVSSSLVSEPNRPNQARQTADGLPERIDSLLGDPNDASDPLAVAELLYLSGRLKTAAVFYRSALSRMTKGDSQDARNRAWAMLQLGDCLREHDPSAATDTYLKLIAEYPNSPWTALARARGRLISWQEKARPKMLIADAKP